MTSRGGAFEIVYQRATPRDVCLCADLGVGRITIRNANVGRRRLRGRQMRRLWPGLRLCGRKRGADRGTQTMQGRLYRCHDEARLRGFVGGHDQSVRPHGYAVKPHISTSLNAATKKCYEFGGKECVIRAWACDAKGVNFLTVIPGRCQRVRPMAGPMTGSASNPESRDSGFASFDAPRNDAVASEQPCNSIPKSRS